MRLGGDYPSIGEVVFTIPNPIPEKCAAIIEGLIHQFEEQCFSKQKAQFKMPTPQIL